MKVFFSLPSGCYDSSQIVNPEEPGRLLGNRISDFPAHTLIRIHCAHGHYTRINGRLLGNRCYVFSREEVARIIARLSVLSEDIGQTVVVIWTLTTGLPVPRSRLYVLILQEYRSIVVYVEHDDGQIAARLQARTTLVLG